MTNTNQAARELMQLQIWQKDGEWRRVLFTGEGSDGYVIYQIFGSDRCVVRDEWDAWVATAALVYSPTADMYLANHRADDDVLVTQEWFNSQGAVRMWGSMQITFAGGSIKFVNGCICLGYRTDEIALIENATRGQFRQLARLLGIVLPVGNHNGLPE